MNRRPAQSMDAPRTAPSSPRSITSPAPAWSSGRGVERAGELAREIGVKKVLLVTDPGVVAAGHAERVGRSLRPRRGVKGCV